MKITRTSAGLVAALLCGPFSSALAQPSLTAAITTDVPGHSIVNAQGMFPTDPNALIFRNGTNPLVPITRSDGTQLTWGQFNHVSGQVRIAPRLGGGTDVDVEVSGLFPGEDYSIWAGWWEEPGFPFGPRIAFGAVSEAGTGADNVMTADANGQISLNLGQLEGPMSVHGSAPSYAALSPAFDSNGDPRPHTGYGVGIAYHFNNAPGPPFFPGPGPANSWALQGLAQFAPIPEPSAVVLLVMGIGVALLARRRLGSS